MNGPITIKRVCDSKGVKYSWLAAQLGISRSHFDHIEAGRRNPPADYYERAARILQVPVEVIRPETEPAEVA